MKTELGSEDFDAGTWSLISFSHNTRIIVIDRRYTRWSIIKIVLNLQQAISLSVFLVESDEKGDNFSVILKYRKVIIFVIIFRFHIGHFFEFSVGHK